MNTKEASYPLVSVIIPVYNCGSTIAETLDSIIRQTYENIEIIIVNDGSTDTTEQVVNDFAKKDSRIKCFSQANQGVSAARNAGISHATGEYISFVDADDTIDENAVQRMVETCDDDDIVIAGIKCIMTLPNGKTRVSGYGHQDITLSTNAEIWEQFFPLFNDGCLNSPCANIYKKSIIVENDLRFDSDLEIGEDLQFNLDFIEYASKMQVISGTLYNYYTNRSFLSKKKKDNLYDTRKKSIDLLEKHLRKHNIDCNVIYYMHLKLMISQAMQEHRNSKLARERREIIKGLLQKKELQAAIANYRAEGLMGRSIKWAVASKKPRVIDTFAKLCLVMSSWIQYSLKRASI